MRNATKEFFRQLGTFAMGGYGSKDFDTASKLLTEACRLSHIRYIIKDELILVFIGC